MKNSSASMEALVSNKIKVSALCVCSGRLSAQTFWVDVDGENFRH